MTPLIIKIIEFTKAERSNSPLSAALIQDAIQEGSCNSSILFDIAIDFAQDNKLDRAIEILTQLSIALKHEPEIFYSLGFIYSCKEEYRTALIFYDKALQIDASHNSALVNKGAILNTLMRYEEAHISLLKAIQVNPNFAEAWSNNGTSLDGLGRYEEALTHYDMAIRLNPGFITAYLNRGNTFVKLKKLDQANSNYNMALGLDSSDAEVNFSKSLVMLLEGHFEQGWKGYEWRWKSKDVTETIGTARTFTQPLWLGEQSLENKTILLYGEQGLGDTIQFCRYANLASKLGAIVILEVQPHLVSLLKDLKGVSQIIGKGELLPEFDYQCPLLSLPLGFKTVLQTIPHTSRYIQSDKQKIESWEKKLGEKTELRVGIAWSGSAIHKNDHNRSLTLAQIISHLPSQYRYICLQKELREVDKIVLMNNSSIQFYGDELKDFTDTAALCELMDVIISVDTSVAHLAGALGKQTWILLPYLPDWRWLLDRNDSPWYPSVKLYRQEKIGDWGRVLDRVKTDLKNLISCTAQ